MSFIDNHELFGEGEAVPHDVQIARVLAGEIVAEAGFTRVQPWGEVGDLRSNGEQAIVRRRRMAKPLGIVAEGEPNE